ncbi:DUF6913 domain-containing protein [Jejuia pallidilutea]|uniref:Uncharacterized protein n=1 Tax=Jejuia pallidilutea TaxID=504487 RepID=A0A090WDX9_9FLAO|nr:hypothetical protein JCM19301_3422 [Jejuia pallidilutea]GAL72832.1 hypothetical protein JCM19302_192 [Jejuia pallidilutea]GAL88601.1 hypothetical protein JCM19538_3114 [Jejuia pallidilutea]
MFLKAFREKSNKKYLNKLLSQRNVNVGNNKIKSLGVILNFDEIEDFNAFNVLASRLKIHANNIKVIAYTTNLKSHGNSWDACFNTKDFGWNGDIKNVELQGFLNEPFDALISYYTKEHLELKLLTALSKSQFKIGILQSDARLNDIIIKTEINEIDVFSDEVVKYLTVLNKI